MRTVLVTGGAGYIGSHACKALAQAGLTPVTFDNLSRGHRWAVNWGPFEFGDLSDRARLREVFSAHKPSAVMHFAAYSYVGESVQNPSDYYYNNIVGSWNLLEAMRIHDVRNMVFSSSCSVYGEGHDSPIKETTAFAPVSPYGATKALVERMLDDYHAAYGLQAVALRYFNAAGADPDGEIGELHIPETHLIPLVLAAADTGAALQVFGGDYPTPDGTCVRDYIHVTDLANAHVTALKMNMADGLHASFNLGTGQGHSVRKILEAAQAITGREVPYTMGPRRAGDPPFAVADPTKARSALKLVTQHSSLENIITTAWRWAQKSKSLLASDAPPMARSSVKTT